MTNTKKEQNNISVTVPNIPIFYTDMVFIQANDDGVVIDVGQKGGGQNQYQIVTRIGMSREHAKKLVKKLSEIIALSASHKHNAGEEN